MEEKVTGNTFLVSTGILVFFDLISFAFGLLPNFLSVPTIISTLITLGLITVVLSYFSPAIDQFLYTIIIICVLFSVSFEVLGHNVTVGIGLCTSLMDLGSPSFETFECFPYYFFLSIGIIGLISGIITMNSGGGD